MTGPGPGSPAGANPTGRDLLIIGAGGFGRETAQAVGALNQARPTWRLLGFVDDDPQRRGTLIDGAAILGGREVLGQAPQSRIVVCTGRPDDYTSRMRIVRELGLPWQRYATIVHPSAAVSASSSLGPGSVLLAQVVLTAAVRVGAHVAVMPHVTLTHDDVIDDFATIASGACLGGGVSVGQAAYIGAGATIGEHRSVGAFALVGMGAVVTGDVPGREVWAGVPARRLRAASVRITPGAEPGRAHSGREHAPVEVGRAGKS